MSQDCFHQTLICLQKICVDNLKKKKKICNSNSQQQKCVRVSVCVFVCLTSWHWAVEVCRARACVCACTVGWTPSPLPSIYTSLPSCISAFLFQSLDVFHLSSSPFSLPASFIHLNSPMSVCVPHTLTFDTHTPSNTIFTLSLWRQGATWKHQCTHRRPILIRLH